MQNLVASLLLLCGCFSSSNESSAASNVVELSSQDFDKVITDGVWFVKFYAPWCQHCRKLEPTINTLSSHHRILTESIKIGRVDCTKEGTICERFGVASYPTLKVIMDGKFYDYSGNRDVESMIKFIIDEDKSILEGETVLSHTEYVKRKQEIAEQQAEAERSSSVVAVTSSSFEKLVLNPGETWILKFYAPWCGHCRRLAPTWNQLSIELAERGAGVKVGKVDCTVHRRVCSRFGVNGYPTIHFIKAGENYKYNGPRNLNSLVEFVTEGYKSAESSGSVPNETLLSKIVDGLIEWATEHTVTAIFAGILLIAIFVAILVALLDYCLGEDDYTAQKTQAHKEARATAGDTSSKPKAE